MVFAVAFIWADFDGPRAGLVTAASVGVPSLFTHDSGGGGEGWRGVGSEGRGELEVKAMVYDSRTDVRESQQR